MLEETYIEIINLKTASLFSAAIKLGLAYLGVMIKKKSYRVIWRNLGLAFQIADDALDYYAKEKLFGKRNWKRFLRKSDSTYNHNFSKANSEEKSFK